MNYDIRLDIPVSYTCGMKRSIVPNHILLLVLYMCICTLGYSAISQHIFYLSHISIYHVLKNILLFCVLRDVTR